MVNINKTVRLMEILWNKLILSIFWDHKSAIALTNIWKDKGISKATKIRIMHTLIFPIALYGCETWSVGMADKNKILAFEMWCWRRMLRISWTEHKTNKFIRNQIGENATLCQRT